jgi:hypothetical protein
LHKSLRHSPINKIHRPMVKQPLVYGFYLLEIGYKLSRFIRIDIKGTVQSLFAEENKLLFYDY